MSDTLTLKTSNGKMTFYLPAWLQDCTQVQMKKLIMLIRTAGWIDYQWDPQDAYKLLLWHMDEIILRDKALNRNREKDRHVKMKNIIKEAAGNV